MVLEISRWDVPQDPSRRYYSGLPWTGFAMRAMSDNHDGLDRSGHGYETVTTAPKDKAQLACVSHLNGSHLAEYYAPVVTWPGCLEFRLKPRRGHCWADLEGSLAGILARVCRFAHGDISFVDGEGSYRPDQPMVIIGRSPNELYRNLMINWPVLGRYGYRYRGELWFQPGDEPDPMLEPILAALDSVDGLDTQTAFVHPNDFSLCCHRGYENQWPEITAAVLKAVAPVVGFDPSRFEVRELKLPFVEQAP